MTNKDFLVIYEDTNQEITYKKRVKGLLKKQRAIQINENTIKIIEPVNEAIYWITPWARFRQDTMIKLRNDFDIHSDFLHYLTKEEIYQSYQEIWYLFTDLYLDLSYYPESYGAALYPIKEYRFYSSQERKSRNDSYRPIEMIYNILKYANWDGNDLVVDAFSFKENYKRTNIGLMLKKLEEYGFFFEGIQNYKIQKDFTISYDSKQSLQVLYLMTQKATNINDVEAFLNCNFRLFRDSIQEKHYGDPLEQVLDTALKEEKDFIIQMHETLLSLGCNSDFHGGYEGPGITYQFSKSQAYEAKIVARIDDIFETVKNLENIRLLLRLRNVNRCVPFIQTCPSHIQDLFSKKSDSGCAKRKTCKFGVAYEMDGTSYWRCGCYRPHFVIKPNVQDISIYIKLLELGRNK